MVYDLIIVGGGLAGSLLLAGAKSRHPQLRCLLLERGDRLCGNHTWSFHETDIPSQSASWLKPLISKTWKEHEVIFPEYRRTLASAYHSIQSDELAQKLLQLNGNEIRLGTEVLRIEKEAAHGFWQVHISSQEAPLQAVAVIDARGWPPRQSNQLLGWQKFVGLDLELEAPHGLDHVVLKDVTVQQIDGYRFFYLLPWSPTQILIEDTYYSNHDGLKVDRIRKEIENYCERRGWKIRSVLREETGALPLFLKAPRRSPDPSAPPRLGASSDYFNPVTGYTLPYTLKAIDALLKLNTLSSEAMSRKLGELYAAESFQARYLTLLNRMMFLAAPNETRYRILQRFYRLPEPLIQRFYGGNLTVWDQLRILMGRPPVPVMDALKVFRSRSLPSPGQNPS